MYIYIKITAFHSLQWFFMFTTLCTGLHLVTVYCTVFQTESVGTNKV